MKTIYSTLAAMALLFSMPALAANLANKTAGENSERHSKDTEEKSKEDKIHIVKEPPQTKAPTCEFT